MSDIIINEDNLTPEESVNLNPIAPPEQEENVEVETDGEIVAEVEVETETESVAETEIDDDTESGDEIEIDIKDTITLAPETPAEEEVQKPHSAHVRQEIPVIDHRLLAGKLTVHDWLGDLPENSCPSEIVEVRFKNTRKAFFSNPSKLNLIAGDIVAVEAALGHDIGVVSLAGELVKEQIRLKKVDLERNPLKKVYRKAKPHDIEKWQQAITMEHETMIRSRKIAADLGLNMKIGDVEYQGDKTKAIFYYIAEDRVDFRKLIKILAETFHIRIEMKQIGARQEAGRIGGIGPCGLKLCCSTFITNFISVSTSAARYQDISLNPQKLAGQCGKLKCCLNYEVDAYIDEQKDFPSTNIWLNTGEGMLYHQKTDIFGRAMWYSFDKEGKGVFIKLGISRIKEIITLNKKGIIPPKAEILKEEQPADIKYTDGVGQDSLSRFDEKKQQNNRNRNRNRNRNSNSNNNSNSNIGNKNNNNSNSSNRSNNNSNNNRRPTNKPTEQ